MSIRPIDMQVMIPKTSEVSKTQQIELQKPGTEQMQFAEQLQKHVAQNQQQILETDKSDKTLIKDEQSRKKGNSRNKKKQNSKSKEKDRKKTESISIFDVKI